jgi:hypothetical protein
MRPLLALAGLALLAVSAALFLTPAPRPTAASSPTPTASPVLTRAPPASCAGAAGEVFADGSLAERTAALSVWAQAHRGARASLMITDSVLEDAVRPDAERAGLREARTRIESDGIHLSGDAVAGPFRFPVRATIVPGVTADGRVRAEIRDLSTGGMPEFLRPTVEDGLRSATEASVANLVLRVERITLQSGCLVLVGVAEP